MSKHETLRQSTLSYTNRDLCNFCGRNGTFKQIGMIVTGFPDGTCMLSPITSKNVEGHGFLQMPIEDIDSLIAILTELKS